MAEERQIYREVKDVLIDGYSARKLLSAMVMAGYTSTKANVAEIIGAAQPITGTRRLKDGAFSREQLMMIKRKLNLKDDEFMSIFFCEDNKPKKEVKKIATEESE